MKVSKIIFASAALAVLGASGIFAAPAKPAKVKVEVVDSAGFPFGEELPAWVKAVALGDNTEVAKALKIDEKQYQVFVFSSNGDNLDFLKTWVDQVDVQRNVANSFSIAVSQASQSLLQGNSGSDATEVNKAINQMTAALSAIELNGLLKQAQYWAQFRRPKQGVKISKKSTDNDFDYYYTYYVVFTMNRKVYDTQLAAALNGVEDNTSETALLKKALSVSLVKPLLDVARDDSIDYDF